MITIKNETPVKLESALQVSAEMIEKLSHIPEKVVKHVCKDLHISHVIDGPMSKSGVLIDHDIDIEQKCDELKKAHQDFLNWLENYVVEDDKEAEEDKEVEEDKLEKYTNLIKNLREEAAKEHIGICAFIENEETIYYTGFMPDVVLAARTIAMNEKD